MARNIEIEIGEEIYTGATSSAKDQIEMLQIATSGGLLPVVDAKASDMALAASLANLDAISMRRLKDLIIVNGKIIRQRDQAPVAENLFQDEVHNYLLLVGKGLRENIGPFWSLSLGNESDGTQNNEA